MNKTVIIIVAAVVLLAIVGGGVFFVMSSGSDEPEPVVYAEYEVGELYTNLADESKILKFNMVVEYTDETILESLTTNKTKIVNNVYEIFRRKTYEQTQSPSFQERTREEIKEMIIEVLETDAETITNVYFLQFIIQG
ncbi:flagellar basal body-associated FliL family protein [Fusibacter sp. JL216-2]|uniref:flagellar basal body-associated FliL family protein n=1 Tax=Fusibacter sp. JL216-2 TaxID=3071453 RepID=UPI003D33F714